MQLERGTVNDEPVSRMSTDNGATFGPVFKLATNGTIGFCRGNSSRRRGGRRRRIKKLLFFL
jgi:hypothetical protein